MKKDINRIESSTEAISKIIKEKLPAENTTQNNNPNQGTGQSGQSNNGGAQTGQSGQSNNGGAQTGQSGQGGNAGGTGQSGQQNANASFIFSNKNYISFNEKVEIKDDPSSNAVGKMNSTNNVEDDDKNAAGDSGAEAAKAANKTANDITYASDKWIRVCNALVSAKLTACQQISNDYMDIIRAHVRSYGGQDKKSKEGNRAPGTSTQYTKSGSKAAVDKAKADAEKAAKEAEQQTQQQNTK